MKRILIVDDQPNNRQYLRTVLEAANYGIIEASDGAEALRVTRSENPDLVLADILMPRMDGCEFVRRLRSETAIANVPVIFLTAHYVEKDLEDLAEACGVFRIITKPVEPEAVLQAVQKAMQFSASSMKREAVERAGDQHLRLLTDTLARKAQQLEVSNRRLDALVQLGQRIAGEHDPRELLSVFCHSAGEILGARCSLVAVSEDDGNTLRHVTGSGVDPQQVGKLTAPSVVAKVFRRYMPLATTQLVHVDESGQDRRELPSEFDGVGSVLLAPIETGARTYGLMCMAGLTIDPAGEPAVKRLTSSMGAVLGVAYENALRYEQIGAHAARLRVEVAERSRAQSEVERANEHLEQRVEERTRELKESHAQLRQAERMASMGTLCAGLGHDMGNVLLPIRARLSALQQIPMGGDGTSHLQAISKFVEYLQSLTNGLRMLAVDSDDDCASAPVTELSHWYQDVEPLLRSSLSGQMTLHATLPSEPVSVKLTRHQLTQAIYNLVHNAADAMRRRRKGRIEIAVELVGGGDKVRCEVADNGPGMSADVQSRAAEPFFTTKHREFSTGLGLSLVRGIVTRAGGELLIESRVDHGTSVVLELPVAVSSEQGDGGGASSDAPLAAVSLKDARLRALGASTLRDLGYRIKPPEASSSRWPNAALWLLDADATGMKDVEGFLADDSARTVVLCGPTAESLPTQLPGVVHIREALRPSELCTRLRHHLRHVRSHDEHADRHPVCG